MLIIKFIMNQSHWTLDIEIYEEYGDHVNLKNGKLPISRVMRSAFNN